MRDATIDLNKTMTILIADDSPTYREVLKALLTDWGFSVIVANDGEKALQLYQEGHGPLLALLDWEMPYMNGIELCHQIRKMDLIIQPHLVMVTTKERGSDKALALDSGANDFVSKPFNEQELQARLNVGERTVRLQQQLRHSLAQLENTMHEQKRTERELREAFSETKGLVASIPLILIEVNTAGKVRRWNKAAENTFQITASTIIDTNFGDLKQEMWDWSEVMKGIAASEQQNSSVMLEEVSFRKPSGCEGIMNVRINPLFTDSGTRLGLLLLGEDLTEHKQLEVRLSLAQKMESIGQLAAGIAHEINTPTQFVSDNLRFLSESFGEIQKVLNAYEAVIQATPRAALDARLVESMETTLAEADLAYVSQEIPKALQQSLDGSERVGKIVRAMKEFSHPGNSEKKPVDLNQAIESTITVARNEWKYVAEMITDLDATLPLIPCLPGEFNQVILNVLINAAHAIGSAMEPESEAKGTITVTTQAIASGAEIRITDTGMGIPEAARKKIFDPFFTTKEVGKGTGQGLAIAHDVIVNKHGGHLSFETAIGLGTTFIIQLPTLESAGDANICT